MNRKIRTKPEVRRYLRVSLSTLNREMAAGHIRFFKIGTKVLFDEADVEAYVASKLPTARGNGA